MKKTIGTMAKRALLNSTNNLAGMDLDFDGTPISKITSSLGRIPQENCPAVRYPGINKE